VSSCLQYRVCYTLYTYRVINIGCVAWDWHVTERFKSICCNYPSRVGIVRHGGPSISIYQSCVAVYCCIPFRRVVTAQHRRGHLRVWSSRYAILIQDSVYRRAMLYCRTSTSYPANISSKQVSWRRGWYQIVHVYDGW